MEDSDSYVDVLIAADAWYELREQDDEPTEAEWDEAHDELGNSVDALREFEASNGTAARDEPWGGTREAMIAVLDAADAWDTLSDDEDPDEAEADAVLDRLGLAVQLLREAEATRDERLLRGEYDQVVQRPE